MIRKVPQDFLLGAALSAYQMEGAAGADGREPSVWDAWLARPGSGYDGKVASDFYHHFEEDIAAAAAHGLRALTLSLSWSRILRADGTVNPDGLAFYDRVIDACRAHGVEPFVALYHFDLPDVYAREGWLAPGTTEAYLRYARVVFQHFGDRVRHFLTMKDPVTEITQGYITGLFPPGQHFALGRAVRALYKMLVAHAQAVLLYKSLNLGGSIDIAHRAICGKPFDIICDDEARLVENPIPSAVNNRGEGDLCGNLFIVKFDGCDDVKSLSSAEVSFILKNTFPAMVERQNARRAITVVRNIGYCRR